MRFAMTGIVLAMMALSSSAADEPASITGGFPDTALKVAAPASGYLTSQKELDKLTEAWKLKPIKIDFTKDLLLVGTTPGSIIQPQTSVMDGNMKLTWLRTKDLRPGFRYTIQPHSRTGVKSINGVDLPAVAD